MAVTWISLERTACFGECPIYTLTLRADGTAIYRGEDYVERVGLYQGRFWKGSFERLETLVERLGFWALEPCYDNVSVTDMPSQIVTVAVGERRKTVEEYGFSGPAELWALQVAIDAVGETVQRWSPDA